MRSLYDHDDVVWVSVINKAQVIYELPNGSCLGYIIDLDVYV